MEDRGRKTEGGAEKMNIEVSEDSDIEWEGTEGKYLTHVEVSLRNL